MSSANAHGRTEDLMAFAMRARHKVLDAIPDASVSMNSLDFGQNELCGPIPEAIGSLLSLSRQTLNLNHLSGKIPGRVGSLSAMCYLSLSSNHLTDKIPAWLGSLSAVYFLDIGANKLSGEIPDRFGSLVAVHILTLSDNKLSGKVPDCMGSISSSDLYLNLSSNGLSGKIPEAMASLAKCKLLSFSDNRLSGKIPDVIASMSSLDASLIATNHLSGMIPDAMTSLTRLRELCLQTNRLSGKIPDALASAAELRLILISSNQLSGTIPTAVASMLKLSVFGAYDNKLSGSIPEGFTLKAPGGRWRRALRHYFSDNRLIGSLPSLEAVLLLTASRNLLEGTLPNVVYPQLRFFDLSGVVGRSGGLKGPLPSALRQASQLQILQIANHEMEGAIPSLTSTLLLLSLHKNRFKVMSAVHLKNNAPRTMILLHNNLSSCHIPWCGNATAAFSIIAIGNQFRYPNGTFPVWLSEYERDPLFWTYGNEGKSLLQKIGGALGFFLIVVASELGSARLLSTMLVWHIAPGTHLWIVQALSHLVSYMVKVSLLVVLLLMFLLSWDLYTCPQTLAMASACLRSTLFIRTSVFLLYCTLAFHSLAVDHLTRQDEDLTKQWTDKMLRKKVLLWLLWSVLSVVFSTLSILYQAGKSIPGFLPANKVLSLGLYTSIGAIQALMGSFIVPFLASKVTQRKHVLTTVSNLIMNCLVPAVIIVYLDTGSFERGR